MLGRGRVCVWCGLGRELTQGWAGCFGGVRSPGRSRADTCCEYCEAEIK
jgi:hypothetical protein